ncbi:MAG: hypothetical protein ABSC24_11410 [Verrucomicrobiota bacterium]|jgi:hypothetical protein
MNQMIELVSKVGPLVTGQPAATIGVDCQHSGTVEVAGNVTVD